MLLVLQVGLLESNFKQPNNSCKDITLKTTNVNFVVTLQRKSQGSPKSSSSIHPLATMTKR